MTSADLIALIKKHPIGFACGALCVICAALLYLRGSKIEENQAEYSLKSAEAAKILANVRFSDKLPEQVAELQTLTKAMEARLIRPGQLAVNLQYFYKLEAETEVKLLDVRQSNPTKGSKVLYVGVPYSVAVQGSFKQVATFLQRLENGPHFCRFLNFSFSKLGGNADGSSNSAATGMTVSINLELLAQP